MHVSNFLTNSSVMSASDDRTVKVWDLSSGQSTLTLEGHKVCLLMDCLFTSQDYIRAGAVNAQTPSIWATGSYDHKIHLWDCRSHKSIACFDHGSPVEDILIFPIGSVLASAGGLDGACGIGAI